MPHTPPESKQSPEMALRMWLEAVQTVRGLALRQLAAIEADDAELIDILADKDSAYCEADALARRATDLGAGHGPGADGLLAAIQAELSELADLEARSEARLGERLNGVREELESLRRGQSAAFAYAPPNAASPRFLDQRR